MLSQNSLKSICKSTFLINKHNCGGMAGDEGKEKLSFPIEFGQ